MTMEGNQGRLKRSPYRQRQNINQRPHEAPKENKRSKVASTKGSVRSCSRIGNLDKKEVPGELSGIDKNKVKSLLISP